MSVAASSPLPPLTPSSSSSSSSSHPSVTVDTNTTTTTTNNNNNNNTTNNNNPTEKRYKKSSVAELPADEQPDNICGFKVSPKVRIEELLNKDKEDPSLKKYRESLISITPPVFPSDPRNVIIKSIRIIPLSENNNNNNNNNNNTTIPPIILDPDDPDLIKKPYTLKENAPFQVFVDFFIQREPVLGLSYVYIVYKHHIRVEKETVMLGSFPPNKSLITIKASDDIAPSGIIARGHYTAKATIVDDDGNVHCEFQYSFDIKKHWDFESEE